MSRRKYNTHHRLAKVNGGKKKYVNGYRNEIRVPVNKHAHFHGFFGTLSVEDMVTLLNRWIDPSYKVICLPRGKGSKGRKKNAGQKNTDNRETDCH